MPRVAHDSWFDVAEWYLRHEGDPYGPLDQDALRSLAASGRVSPAALVRLGEEGVWQRLDGVLALGDFSITTAVQPVPEPEEPIVASFVTRRWRRALWIASVSTCVWVIAVLASSDLGLRDTVFGLVAIVSMELLLAPRERVDLTPTKLILVQQGGHDVMALSDIDRIASADSLLSALLSVRTIRSMNGARLSISRWEYSRDDYDRLMGVLGLDS